MRFARFVVSSAALVACLFVPSVARAQFYFQGYFGGNHTQSSDIRIQQPGSGVDLTFTSVPWEAKPIETPPYYGYRAGYTSVHNGPTMGIEFEFLHMKAYADTLTPVGVVGKAGGASVAGTATMAARGVERYSMSHGLNFLLINAVVRQPVGKSGAKIVVRGGLGPTLPHGESVVFGVSQEQYEWAGVGGQAAMGVELPIAWRIIGVAEYK